jgi:uncharacterized damage-inducible protein DinB
MTNKEFFINSWKSDHAKTAKGFRSLPADAEKLNIRHHASFRSPNELINHIGPHAKELHQAVTTGRMDLVNEGKFDITAAHIYKTPELGAKEVEDYSAKLVEELSKIDDKTWETKNIPVYWGDMKIMEMPLMNVSWMMLFDSIHHRGQLTSYYRPMGTTQPNLMGPTLEEEEAMMAAMKN